jgi:hypothetical protein
LRKNSDFDLVLKGRGFSRAVSAAKSIAALAAALHSVQSDFFRKLFSDARKSFEIRRPFRGWAAISDAFRSPLREPPANFFNRDFILQSVLAHPKN